MRWKVKKGDMYVTDRTAFVIDMVSRDSAEMSVYCFDRNRENYRTGMRLRGGKFLIKHMRGCRLATKTEIAKYKLLAGW